jgi:type IV pilus assembly protein PilB
MVQFDEEKQKARIAELRAKEEEEVAKILAVRYGLNYLDLGPVAINSEALRLLPEETARDTKVAVFDITDRRIQVAVLAPGADKTAQVIKKLEEDNYFPTLSVVSTASLEKAWGRYSEISGSSASRAGTFDIANESVTTLISEIKSIQDVQTKVEGLMGIKQTYRISKILEIMLAGALALKASDIHIEPEEEFIRMRYRLDGVLLNITQFDKPTYKLLLSRIKLLSGLKLNVISESQDGRFSVEIQENDIQIRTSILPGAYNESVVMRILNPKSISVPLEELGIEKRTLDILLEQIQKPNGMLLITGPTGSGKTTTLYAFMRKIFSSEIKIITIEDPIEYHLPGVVQTQVEEEKGYTFLSGLRAALRQDPDVIMVGEIRDTETAAIAINSALTGHLVFSTLHTNSAAGAFPRLIDLKVNPKIISSAVNITMAQRLIRKLCLSCRQERVMDEKEKELVKKIIEGITDKTYIEGVQMEKVWESKGCEKCHNTGYKGRVAICEAILTTKEVTEAIVSNPSDRDIKKAALPQNILDMRQDGTLKVLKGVSTFDELSRVIDLESED